VTVRKGGEEDKKGRREKRGDGVVYDNFRTLLVVIAYSRTNTTLPVHPTQPNGQSHKTIICIKKTKKKHCERDG